MIEHTAYKRKTNTNYYNGGFAEIVTHPTPLTYSFFAHWFTGKNSIGKAMNLLKLPYSPVAQPLLAILNNQLMVNLTVEETTLYQHTIFSYKKQQSYHQLPKLSVNVRKIFNPVCLFHTAKLTFVQSTWIGNPEKMTRSAQTFCKKIPITIQEKDLEKLDQMLGEDVWPYTIAIGLLSEFYYQLLMQQAKRLDCVSEVEHAVSSRVAKQDWFFKSLIDQQLVKTESISFETYLKMYGLRADDDYELTQPRWHEIPKTIKKRIDESTQPPSQAQPTYEIPKKLLSLAETTINFLVLRSATKRQTLVPINALRQTLLKKHNTQDLALRTREELLSQNFQHTMQIIQTHHISNGTKMSIPQKGQGIPVSQGISEGKTQHITSNSDKIINNVIGIFPNASPQFALIYPQCKGMIFLKGGQTSHGAIVAREFGIPALIDPSAQEIPNYTLLSLNGKEGTWKVLAAH